MKIYEIMYCTVRLLEHPLYRQIYLILKERLKPEAALLDIGGRASPYTIGLKCKVYISELRRESELQRSLSLGIDNILEKKILKRRSNIAKIVYDDMVNSKLDDNSFDLITAVEVLEHVENDRDFIKNVTKILKSDGSFIMSTPNGDYRPNTNPDHKRHYTLESLNKLLLEHFRLK
jgi:cyclopropane fatty-acyl-phospholipid synthase-like methyltransferase